jgi:colanic acid/amylovoran biosynthesis glycosyltransferase
MSMSTFNPPMGSRQRGISDTTGMPASAELLLLLPLRVFRDDSGRRLLTRKILQGAAAFAERWPGPVTMLAHESTVPFSDLDPVDIDAVSLPFNIELRPDGPDELAARLRNAAMVLSFLARDGLALAKICKGLRVPLIFYSEYSLEVEWQIIDATTNPGLRRWRRKLWARRSEVLRRRALRLATGVQCSGTPTFETYRNLLSNALLFFDNRVRRDWIIDAQALRKKYDVTSRAGPLRLVFGGRLIRMKGGQYLPELASRLRQSGVAFQLTIYGDGELRSWLVHELETRGGL